MTNAGEPTPAQPERRDWLTPTLNVAIAFGTMVAAIAAAYSAWASWQTIQQARDAQLLERRVAACFEVDRDATAEIRGALQQIRESADEEARAALRGEFYLGYSFGGFTPGQNVSCFENETTLACGERLQTLTARYNEMVAVADSAAAERGRLEFESEATFRLIGTPPLAAAERELLTRLRALRAVSGADNQSIEIVNTAIQSHTEFLRVCRAEISDYWEQ